MMKIISIDINQFVALNCNTVRYLSLLFLLNIAFIGYASGQPGNAHGSCAEILEAVIQKTESNYAGFIHKVIESDNTEKYNQHTQHLIRKADETEYINCYWIIDDYVKFFDDGHLFIYESPRVNPDQSDSLLQSIERLTLPNNYKDDIEAHHNVEPISGIWKENDMEVAIVKAGTNEYKGVVINSKVPEWEAGMVRMEIQRNENQTYDIVFTRNDFYKVRFAGFQIYKNNTVFPFGMYRYVKVFPENPELKYVDISNPALPTGQILDSEKFLLTIPSALIEGNYLDNLITHYENEIKTKKYLIVDIRSNTGGNYIWRKLNELANTRKYQEVENNDEDDFLMLASEDNAEYWYRIGNYWRQVNDSTGIKYYDDLKSRILANSGNIMGVSFYDPSEPDTTEKLINPLPQKIAIIIDKGVASAAEALILSLKENSDRIQLFGENTYGMIDYMNVNIVRPMPEKNSLYLLGYPTFFSKDLRTNPVNPTGIIPDVDIPENEKDWIQWVIEYLN